MKIFTLACSLFFVAFVAQGQTFTELSSELNFERFCLNPWYMGGGVAFFDLNKDGYDDLYFSGGLYSDRIYLNQAGVSFIELNIPSLQEATDSIYTNGVAIGDVDNDGDDDIFVICGSLEIPQPNILLLNQGNSAFVNASEGSPIAQDTAWSMAATMGDYNLDGFLDLYVGNYYLEGDILEDSLGIHNFIYEGFSNEIFYNDGTGQFVNQTENYGFGEKGLALAAASTDFDMDNDIDIYLANDFGFWNAKNALWQNNYPSDSWTDVAEEAGADLGIFAMGVAIGDYDEDLDFDYYVTNLGRNVLLNNDGLGHFEDHTTAAGVENTFSDTLFSTSWGTAFVDLNNDTYLDLVVANGQIPAVSSIATNPIDSNKVFINNGDGTFYDHSLASGIFNDDRDRGLAYGDFDNDGDIDILMGSVFREDYPDQHHLIYRNDLENENNWLKIRLEGVEVNRNGYGAKVILETGGRSFIREMDGGSSHCSRNANFVHFGLGSIESVDNVKVIWPGGMEQEVGPLAINESHLIVEEEAGTGIMENENAFFNKISLSPNPINGYSNLHVDSSNGPSITLQIYNLEGKLMLEELLVARENSLDYPLGNRCLEFEDGMYLIKLTSDNTIRELLFIK